MDSIKQHGRSTTLSGHFQASADCLKATQGLMSSESVREQLKALTLRRKRTQALALRAFSLELPMNAIQRVWHRPIADRRP